MLTIYKTSSLVPKDLEVVRTNDSYFNLKFAKEQGLDVDDTVRNLINTIDKSEPETKLDLRGISGELVSYRKLSTGCKTAINIYKHNDTCFDTLECGNNAIMEIIKLPKGHAVIRRRPLNLQGDNFEVNCKVVTPKGEVICKDYNTLAQQWRG